MITFSREELKDVVNAIDVITGAYAQELEEPIKELYRHDSPGFHRLRSVQHRLLAALNESADESA